MIQWPYARLMRLGVYMIPIPVKTNVDISNSCNCTCWPSKSKPIEEVQDAPKNDSPVSRDTIETVDVFVHTETRTHHHHEKK